MTSVVFVHGTGVRGAAYEKTFSRIHSALLERLPEVNLLPCQWGDVLGAVQDVTGHGMGRVHDGGPATLDGARPAPNCPAGAS
ncbi:hypothetical protein ACWCQ0_36490 [Streptomyces massasporeus]|uniref:Alpha/beta hydrolase family protein n=1 Tax=Streptomyces massasporeus TaxID=67324 RepID=A0ABW6LKZ0_9ACTN